MNGYTRNLTIVPLVGIEGEAGKLTGHYTFTAVSNGSISYSTVEGSGVSIREYPARCKSEDE